MAHFAQLNSQNEVLDVLVVDNENVENLPFPDSEPVGIAFLNNLLQQDLIWKQTSYNNKFRARYAGIGMLYNLDLDVFVWPQPYPSWVLNTQTYDWEAPVLYPTDGKKYHWDEATLEWVLDGGYVNEPPVVI